MDKKELKYWLGISSLEEIGAIRFKRLLNKFKPLKTFFQADLKEICQAGIEPWVVKKIIAQREKINLEEKWQQLEKEGIKLITYQDKKYPKLLKEIYDYPPLLYIRGEFKERDKFSLAVVGTRKPSHYGQQATLEIVRGLAQAQLTVVSGLAVGIDSQAHQAALSCGGRTIAVLGTGLDWPSVYPRVNRKLVQEIIETGGAVISEFPCGMPAHKQNFPLRNRLISGLALGTLIIEAGEGSGALITASCALDQNREVFALPGSIFNQNSQGTNYLIKQGAKLVTRANDILETLDLGLVSDYIANQEIVADSQEEEILLQFLSKEPVHIDQLVLESGLAVGMINSVLILMEMKGKVKNLGNQMYVLI